MTPRYVVLDGQPTRAPYAGRAVRLPGREISRSEYLQRQRGTPEYDAICEHWADDALRHELERRVSE